jgi:hypothetical protein
MLVASVVAGTISSAASAAPASASLFHILMLGAILKTLSMNEKKKYNGSTPFRAPQIKLLLAKTVSLF